MTRLVDLPTPALLVDADALDHNLADDGRRPARVPGCARTSRRTSPPRWPARRPPPGHRGVHLRHDPRGRGHGRGRAGRRPAAGQRGARRAPARRAGRQRGADHASRSTRRRRIEAAAGRRGPRGARSTSTSACPAAAARPSEAGRLADLARGRGLSVRGVMGYEGHLMMLGPTPAQRGTDDRGVAWRCWSPRTRRRRRRGRLRRRHRHVRRSTPWPPRSRPARTR